MGTPWCAFGHPWALLGRPWAHRGHPLRTPGHLLGTLCATVGALWRHRALSGRHFGHPGHPPGTIWTHLGGHFHHPGTVPPKRQKNNYFYILFGDLLEKGVHAIRPCQCSPNTHWAVISDTCFQASKSCKDFLELGCSPAPVAGW